MRDSLKMLRSKVNKIDGRISKLLDCRADISRKIGSKKKKRNIAVVDREREKEIIANVTINRKNRKFIRNCFAAIMKESRRLQRGLKK